MNSMPWPSWFLRVGFRVRLVLLMTAVVLALIFNVYSDAVARREQRIDEITARMTLIARHYAEHQFEFASAVRNILNFVVRLGPLADLCGPEVRSITAENKWILNISMVSTGGHILCSSHPGPANFNISDRPYFKEAISTGTFVLSDYLVGRRTNLPLLMAAMPRFDRVTEEVDAVVIASIDLGWLNRIAEQIGGGANTTVLLLDSAGTAVSTNRSSRTLEAQNVSSDRLIKALIDGASAVRGAGPDKVARLYVSAPLQGTKARLVLGYPEADLLAPIYRDATLEFARLATYFAIIFLVAWLAGEHLILQPIRRMTQAASALGSRLDSARLDPREMPRDFMNLAATFNTTADALARNEELIKQKNLRLRQANTRLGVLARQDVLTGLANRRVLMARLNRIFRRPDLVNRFALLVLDLDKFKPVNDLLGHSTGDLILREVAVRLRSVLSKGDLAVRLGGDEFAVLVFCRKPSRRPLELAEAINKILSCPFQTPSGPIEVGCTIGLAMAGRDGADPEELLRAADIAMYQAKRDERGGCKTFNPAMKADLQVRMSLESELRAGIKAGEIVPYYQPILDLRTRQIVTLEILARWHHPARGVLPPGLFIGIAAETGLAGELTRSLLGTACLDSRDWPEHISLALNLSPDQLRDRLLPTSILAILAQHNFRTSRLEIEITEDALVRDLPVARAVMHSFKSFGIKVALDDFGTGYSSLQHLHELEIDKIKIDRTFVTNLATDEDSRKLVVAIIGLADSMGLSATAEGIEDSTLADTLRDMGCAFGQGYIFGRPMPASEISELIRRNSGSPRVNVA